MTRPAGPPAPAAGEVAIGVDIGGTKIAAALVSPAGRVLAVRRSPTPAAAGRQAVLDATAALVDEMLAQARTHCLTPTHLGVGSAGIIDPATGDVAAATGHIAGWAGTPLARHLSARCGLPTAALNDVHAHALGEARHGAGAGHDTMLLIAAGTGLGGSLVARGAPMLGRHGLAGHVGHVPAPDAAGMPCACGGASHLESVASGGALPALYRRLAGSAPSAPGGGSAVPASGADVLAAATAGDPAARAAVELTARALGQAVGGWINTFDPDLVVVTGGLTGAGDTWWATLRQTAAREALPPGRDCPIVPATLGPEAALIGAAGYRPAATDEPARSWHTGEAIPSTHGGDSCTRS